MHAYADVLSQNQSDIDNQMTQHLNLQENIFNPKNDSSVYESCLIENTEFIKPDTDRLPKSIHIAKPVPKNYDTHHLATPNAEPIGALSDFN